MHTHSPLCTIRMGHGPDADDAFLFYAIKHGRIGLRDAQFTHQSASMQALNEGALRGDLDVTAISAACYPHVADRYWIMSCGGSMTTCGGPVLVARARRSLSSLREGRIAIAGRFTTGHMLLRLALDDWEAVACPYNEIASAVADGDVDAGLMIHEGQVTYRRWNLHKVLDLGEWWQRETGLPLPLALNVVAKTLGRRRAEELVALVRDSARWAFAHETDALRYAQQYAGGLDEAETLALATQFLNEHSLQMSPAGRAGLETLFERAAARGLCPAVPAVEIV